MQNRRRVLCHSTGTVARSLHASFGCVDFLESIAPCVELGMNWQFCVWRGNGQSVSEKPAATPAITQYASITVNHILYYSASGVTNIYVTDDHSLSGQYRAINPYSYAAQHHQPIQKIWLLIESEFIPICLTLLSSFTVTLLQKRIHVLLLVSPVAGLHFDGCAEHVSRNTLLLLRSDTGLICTWPSCDRAANVDRCNAMQRRTKHRCIRTRSLSVDSSSSSSFAIRLAWIFSGVMWFMMTI